MIGEHKDRTPGPGAPGWVWFLILLVGAGTTLGTAPKETPVEVTLGVILPLTGTNALNGQAAKQGVDLAVETRQSELRKRGVRVGLKYADDRMDPEAGAQAAGKLVDEDGVTALIGPFTSPGVLAVAPIANRERVVLVSGSATSPVIREAGEFVFRTVSPDTYHGRAIARFAFETLRARRAAVLYLDNEYGRGLKTVAQKGFQQLGGEVVFQESFARGTRQFGPLVEAVQQARPHVVFLLSYPPEAAAFLKQAHRRGFGKPVVGGDGMYSRDLANALADLDLDVYASGTSWRPGSNHKPSREFVARYENKYGTLPNLYAAYYYDAAHVVLEALAQGARTPLEIRNFLLEKELEGVTGKILFDDHGDVAKPIDLYRVEGTRFEYFFTIQP